MSNKVNLLDYDRKSLGEYFTEIGDKSFRAQQVLKWIYHQGVVDFEGMTNLSKPLRAKLEQNTCIKPPEIISEQKSEDGTYKWLIQIDGGNSVETVFIPESDRGTLCISSQIGCPLECKFCSTGQQGFNRNLTTSEIIGQVWTANKALGYFESDKRVITNIVFMGMGEPLLNYDNVLKAINLLTDDLGFGLARRRVTVSTSGIIPEIDRLKEDTNVSLAISLHASNNELRNSIVPINRSYPMVDLLAACRRFTEARDNEPLTIEYVMLKDVNDSIEDARNLVKCLNGLPAKVNLIPFNTFPGTSYDCSDMKAINAFRDVLIKSNIITITRKTRGDDIDAACGQLVGKVMAKAARYQKGHIELN
ncbi:MAG: 23S rRNA (adenine(2503)-C(2))-methyltransferase RlmN [Proteobacteria bacterium]|nr:23S rRNA (adenine(2503)-C(2))-methyltransferase RlmN [Pseudomonadota bacterium]NOG61453.1 23S rRNA (adenine(2503)-C(2))-methyltransferase RlmN [Pseudomonadota bacterium]